VNLSKQTCELKAPGFAVCMIYSLHMAKRQATNTKNKTSRSKKTRKRIAAKYEKLAAKATKKRK
jgi:hypothetical protein